MLEYLFQGCKMNKLEEYKKMPKKIKQKVYDEDGFYDGEREVEFDE